MKNNVKTPLGKLLVYILDKAGNIPIPIDEEFTKLVEGLDKLQEVALEAAEILEEVRTGEDFECVCHEKADEVRMALGMGRKYD